MKRKKRRKRAQDSGRPGSGLVEEAIFPSRATDSAANGNAFPENPFRGLDIRNFPKGKSGEMEREKEKGDSILFLRALESMRKQARRKSGFPLAALCDLARIGKMKRKTASPPKPAEKPEPVKNEKIDDGLDAFMLAMRNTKPLTGRGRQIVPRVERKSAEPGREPGFEELLGKSLEFTLLFSDEYLEGHVAGLDDMIMNRLRNGQMSPEAHLDLHGLNAEQAFEALRAFMRDAWFKSLRVVLVVTGRGRNSPAGQGVLRRKLQGWLTQEPFKRVVLGFCTARPHDGGPGSIYVLLRKFRKKGRISWDSYAADADLYQNLF